MWFVNARFICTGSSRCVLGPDHPNTTNSLTLLGELDLDQRRYAEAEPHLISSYQGLIKQQSTDSIRFFSSEHTRRKKFRTPLTFLPTLSGYVSVGLSAFNGAETVGAEEWTEVDRGDADGPCGGTSNSRGTHSLPVVLQGIFIGRKQITI